MNAHTFPASIRRIIQGADPLMDQARRMYAGMMPEITETARIPAPLAHADEAQDAINRHALRLALALLCVAAERANRPEVENIAAAILQGDEWSTRYARSCNDDDLAMVESAGSELRDAAENIAGIEWSV